MIILPDKNIPRSKFLLPMKSRHWRTPSQAQVKDFLGNENHTRFRIRARVNDGFIVWTGWFDDREDFDAFLWAIATGSLKYEKDLWRMPSPEWHPGIGESIVYDFAVTTFITTLTTYTSPIDWNNADNTVEAIGGGGAGAQRMSASTSLRASGGGGGEYRAIANFNFAVPGTTSAACSPGAGVSTTQNTSISAGGANGGSGGNTTFNTTSLIANGGAGGTSVASTTNQAGGAGGSGGTGALANFDGGSGGTTTATFLATGGGAAAGPGGAGGSSSSRNGGTGGGGAGGSAGVGSTSATAAVDGGNGTDLTGSFGSGGGGGAHEQTNASSIGSDGGFYGGGGGACVVKSFTGTKSYKGGHGRQGCIYISYTPLSVIAGNMPMLGM